jgi:hypothetical protein
MCSAKEHVRFAPNSDRESGHWLAPSWAIRRRKLDLWMLSIAPAIRLSRKDWLLRANRAVLCPVPDALRDPAPPAALLRWGFGGDGDGRRTIEGDPDDQGNGEA